MKYCPICESESVITVVTANETVVMKNVRVVYRSRAYLCSKCEERFQNIDMLQGGLDAARDAYVGKTKMDWRKIV